jgi:hypothetical protein
MSIRVLILIFVCASSAFAATEAKTEITTETPSWTDFRPYIPEKHEYHFELGGMWEADNLYWLGLTYGRHMGKCAWVPSGDCHQYFDITGGVGGREAYTDGLVLVGLRWQHVTFPKPYSPSYRLFGGVMNIRDNERDRQVGVYGVGIGYTASLHQKMDVKWETRIGGGDQFWAQTMLSLSFKIDSWVDGFGEKLKSVGWGAVEKTGSVIKSTFTAPKTFIDWFNKPPDDKPKTPDSTLPELPASPIPPSSVP